MYDLKNLTADEVQLILSALAATTRSGGQTSNSKLMAKIYGVTGVEVDLQQVMLRAHDTLREAADFYGRDTTLDVAIDATSEQLLGWGGAA